MMTNRTIPAPVPFSQTQISYKVILVIFIVCILLRKYDFIVCILLRKYDFIVCILLRKYETHEDDPLGSKLIV
jgi:hypothetical protein